MFTINEHFFNETCGVIDHKHSLFVNDSRYRNMDGMMSFPKEFCGILYSCGKVIDITWHRLCQKLDDDHASRMSSRQLTSDTNYTTHTSPQTHHQLIHILKKSHLRGSTRIAKQPRFLKIQKSLFTKMLRETSFANARPFWSSSGD